MGCPETSVRYYTTRCVVTQNSPVLDMRNSQSSYSYDFKDYVVFEFYCPRLCSLSVLIQQIYIG
jgi:hypothetical protein